MKQNEEKIVLIYCRESRDDYGENYERIETQRDLLLKFCRSHGYKNILEPILDDDKTGTDFSRFEQIRKMARNREIDVIVFKNSSRLGRNQKEALDFVEYIEEQGVEIIFEDEKYDEEMFGLYAWFNERRARDDSKNIRRNLRHKIEEGELIVKAIYGYNKEGNSLVKNENTAPIVKEIFELYSKGWGYNKIAKYLNKKGVATPSEARNFENSRKTNIWNTQHILRILADRRYIGDYVGGRTEKISFKSKKTRVKPNEEWTIIEGHHEAIIDKNLFDKVKTIRDKRKRDSNKYSDGFKFVDTDNNLYSGLLYCGRCGGHMYKRKGTTGTRKRPDSYLCKKYSREGVEKTDIKDNYGCKPHRTRIEYLDAIVNGYIYHLIENKEFIQYAMENVNAISNNKNNILENLKRAKENVITYEKQYEQVYDDKLKGVVPEFIYNKKKKELESRIENEKYIIKECEDKLKTVDKVIDKKKLIKNELKDIKENGLTKEELTRVFDKIVVYGKGEITREIQQKYNIGDKLYDEMYEQGGIVFSLKFMYPHFFTNRRLRYWSKANRFAFKRI